MLTINISHYLLITDAYCHDNVTKWQHFPPYWTFERGCRWSPVNSPHKGQWRGALMFSLICAWINVWVNYREAGGLRRHRAHYDVTVIYISNSAHYEKEEWAEINSTNESNEYWCSLHINSVHHTSLLFYLCHVFPLLKFHHSRHSNCESCLKLTLKFKDYLKNKFG